MTSIILFSNIFLFSISCIGAASTIYLHTCLKMKLTGLFSILFLILLFSLGRILLSFYFSSQDAAVIIPTFLNIALGVILSLSVYVLIYYIMLELKNSSRISAFFSTVFIISVQAGRTLLYYSGRLQLVNLLHAAFICIISAYLFFVGLMLYRGISPQWNPAVQRMIRSLGIVTLIFAPLSAAIYIFLYIFKIKNQISLDFILMGIWGIVVMKVLLHYLSRIGTIPVSGAVDDAFIIRYKISKREKEVLALILEGYTNKEIGEKLYISFTTARTHVSHIFEKAGVNSRIELVSKVISEKP